MLVSCIPSIELPPRVLNPPTIGYKKQQDGKPIKAEVEMGKWNMPKWSNFVAGSLKFTHLFGVEVLLTAANCNP